MNLILIIDFGSQVSHLITRRIRQLGVFSEIVPCTTSMAAIKSMKPDGIILSGGPRSVYEKGAPDMNRELFSLGIPILGICYGHQILAHVLGGKVVSGSREYGLGRLSILKSSSILEGLSGSEQVWMSHGDSVIELPEGFEAVGSTADCKIAAFANEKERIYGVQFHPEVQHTVNGTRILDNFISICNAKKDYSVKGLVKRIVDEVKATVKDDGVIMAVSGGVDSLVASFLIAKATKNLHLVFVDNGLLRKGEVDEVREIFSGFENFNVVDASSSFISRIGGVTEPEAKRKIIGNLFVEVFERKVEDLRENGINVSYLGQGTIYPDRIESAQPSKSASLIKTHHNVGGLPERMKLRLVEPLRDLYKDEVRELGIELGIGKRFLFRHPFPGPGLAVRVLGEVTGEKLAILREADSIFIDELKKSGFYEKTWQAFAALLPVKSVGVMGDERTYGYIIALRAVVSADAMTADWAKLPLELLESVSSRIVRSVKGVNRVVYDITQKPPGTIEFE
ncbi:glutamine-hydrolyzing GMP synthase [Candidatus Woesearchaeota archaeon]|nr:glutamine-hydrolyzing GMP synthase [Candidatus Woesearchaeota archaeon]